MSMPVLGKQRTLTDLRLVSEEWYSFANFCRKI